VAKAGTVPELHPELEAEMDAAAVGTAGDAAAVAGGTAAAAGGAAAAAGEVAAAPCRQKAAGVVLPQ